MQIACFDFATLTELLHLNSECGDKYGPGCELQCSCGQGGQCDPLTGKCKCRPGWTGPECRESKFGTMTPFRPTARHCTS